MKIKFDEFDLLLEILGYHHPDFELTCTEDSIQKKFHEAYAILKELNITDSTNQYKLYLHSNDFIQTNREFALSTLHGHFGYTIEEAEKKIQEANMYFKIELLEGNSRNLYPKLFRSIQSGLNVTMEYFRRKY